MKDLFPEYETENHSNSQHSENTSLVRRIAVNALENQTGLCSVFLTVVFCTVFYVTYHIICAPSDQRSVQIYSDYTVCETVKTFVSYDDRKTAGRESYIETQNAANAPININTATLQELTSIDGIGENRASAIIEYRQEHGKYQSVDDLKNIKGIVKS